MQACFQVSDLPARMAAKIQDLRTGLDRT